MTMEQAFELHDLLGNLPSVRLVATGLDFEEAAAALGLPQIMVEADWANFRGFGDVFPGFTALKRERDARRLENAVAIVDKELAAGSPHRRELALWRYSLLDLAGKRPAIRNPQPRRPVATKTEEKPTRRRAPRGLGPVRAEGRPKPRPIQVVNLAEKSGV